MSEEGEGKGATSNIDAEEMTARKKLVQHFISSVLNASAPLSNKYTTKHNLALK